MKILLNIIFILFVTTMIYGQKSQIKYNFQFDEPFDGFTINIEYYPDERGCVVNSIIHISKENQIVPFQFRGNLKINLEGHNPNDPNYLSVIPESIFPKRVDSEHDTGLFFFDVDFDGVKELFISSMCNYNIYNLETGEPYIIETKNLEEEYGDLGYQLYNYRGGFILDSQKQEIEKWGSNSSVSGSYEKYKFYNGYYYLIEEEEWDYSDYKGKLPYKKTVKIEIGKPN